MLLMIFGKESEQNVLTCCDKAKPPSQPTFPIVHTFIAALLPPQSNEWGDRDIKRGRERTILLFPAGKLLFPETAFLVSSKPE